VPRTLTRPLEFPDTSAMPVQKRSRSEMRGREYGCPSGEISIKTEPKDQEQCQEVDLKMELVSRVTSSSSSLM
jgi:hypothetical protein